MENSLIYPDVTYYHGTDLKSGQKICQHVRVDVGTLGELGTGFYIGNSLMYACERAYLRINSMDEKGKTFCIIDCSLENPSTIKKLSRKEVQELYRTWLSAQFKCRKYIPQVQVFTCNNILCSSILDDGVSNSTQFKFESESIANTIVRKIHIFK